MSTMFKVLSFMTLFSPLFGMEPTDKVHVEISPYMDIITPPNIIFRSIPGTSQLLVKQTQKDDTYLVSEWNLRAKNRVYSLVPDPPYTTEDSADVSPNGKILLVVQRWEDNKEFTVHFKLLIIDNISHTVLRTITDFPKGYYGVHFAADGNSFLIREIGGARVFDLHGEAIKDYKISDYPDRARSTRVWFVAPSKIAKEALGLHIVDDSGKEHVIDIDTWPGQLAVTKSGYIVTMTWNGEMVIYRLKDATEVYRDKVADQYGGYLAYDEMDDLLLWSKMIVGEASRHLQRITIEPSL